MTLRKFKILTRFYIIALPLALSSFLLGMLFGWKGAVLGIVLSILAARLLSSWLRTGRL